MQLPTRQITMPALAYPLTCGATSCKHPLCNRWREHAERRCSHCDARIAVGEQFVELRDPFSRNLIEQHHVVCPPRVH